MNKLFILLLIGLLLPLTVLGQDAPEKGDFICDGNKYTYTTASADKMYFGMRSKVYVHTLDANSPIPNNDACKKAVAETIGQFYAGTVWKPDIKWKADPKDWKKSNYQKVGMGIHSSNYGLPCIWIDFKLSDDKKFILQIYHAAGL